MANLYVRKEGAYGESTVTIVGVTRSFGRPQYILVDSDEGATPSVKFPGLRFRAPCSSFKTLEDSALERFHEQTGLRISHSLGLRCIIPTRSRHESQWQFRNVFFGVVNDIESRANTDGRNVYLADVGEGRYGSPTISNGSHDTMIRPWVHRDNCIIARHAYDVVTHLNWQEFDSAWFRRIPCVPSVPQTSQQQGALGTGMAVSSIILLYQPAPDEPGKVILIKRKGDEHPGYAGGKIETPEQSRLNIDPVSCCAQEGAEEFGFHIQPRALVCVATTALEQEDGAGCYNSIVTYAFVAEATNQSDVEAALRRGKPPENKMECYVVEDLDTHRKRVDAGALRMPDMRSAGTQFFEQLPGQRINLTQIISSGLM